jgi:DNA-binding transcriptional ArsR family regulator
MGEYIKESSSVESPASLFGEPLRLEIGVGLKIEPRIIGAEVERATRLLKSLANPHRLLILCHLVEEERSVGWLEKALEMPQAHLSQQLARLRREGLVKARRQSRMVYYRLASKETAAILALLYELYCGGAQKTAPKSGRGGAKKYA